MVCGISSYIWFLNRCFYNLAFWGWLFFFVFIYGIIWNIYRIILWLDHSYTDSLSYMVVTGNRRFTTIDDVKYLIMQLGKLGTFITQDVNIVQNQIEQLSWIKQVSVRKKWPDTLQIHLVEYNPLVCWNINWFISSTGVVFYLPKYLINNDSDIKTLPMLLGPIGKEQEVLNSYLIFNEVLKSIKFYIILVKMDDRDSYELILHNGMHLKLGRMNVIEKLRYFIKIYPIVLEKISEQHRYIIDYIDLRYTSGFAIKWIPDDIIPALCNQ